LNRVVCISVLLSTVGNGRVSARPVTEGDSHEYQGRTLSPGSRCCRCRADGRGAGAGAIARRRWRGRWSRLGRRRARGGGGHMAGMRPGLDTSAAGGTTPRRSLRDRRRLWTWLLGGFPRLGLRRPRRIRRPGGFYGHGYSTGAYWRGGYWHGGYWPRAYYGLGSPGSSPFCLWLTRPIGMVGCRITTPMTCITPTPVLRGLYGHRSAADRRFFDGGSGRRRTGRQCRAGPAPAMAVGQPQADLHVPEEWPERRADGDRQAECQQWASQQAGQVAQNGSDYQRAMMACVEGRGIARGSLEASLPK